MTRTYHFARTAALVVALVLGLGVLAAWNLLDARAAREADALARARDAHLSVESTLRADLAHRAELVADDPAFAGYVEMAIGGALPGVPVDTTSLVDLLRERQERLDFAFVAVLDPNGRVVGSTSPLLPDGRREQGDVFISARDRDATATGAWAVGTALFHVAVVPLSAVGVSEGFLMTGRPLGQGYVDALAAGGGIDATVLRRGARESSASTLGDALRPDFVLGLRGAALAPGGQGRIEGRAVAVEPVLGSRLAAVALAVPEAPVRTGAVLPWIAAVLLVVVAFAFAAAQAWRRVLAPAALITDRLERAAAGDLHVQVVDTDAGALLPLASAFNRLLARVRDLPRRAAA